MTHPITPPPELIRQWFTEFYGPETMPGMTPGEAVLHVAAVAARWGADQELEACCDFLELEQRTDYAALLRVARRPKSLGLKERALKALDSASYQPGSDFKQIDPARLEVIRRALECIPDLQS